MTEQDALLLRLKLKKNKIGLYTDKIEILGRKESRKIKVEDWFK